MVEKLLKSLPKIGYLFHYPNPDHPDEKFRLDIYLSSTPTEKHFDVHHAYFTVEAPNKTIERITVTHPWVFQKKAHVCAGRITLEDRKKKKEEAFTFGGELRIDVQEMQTECVLVSSAPILGCSHATLVHGIFIDEVQILLAEHRAQFSKINQYEKQICYTDPNKLYLACLKEVMQKIEKFPLKDENYLHLLAFLHSEQHRLAAAGLYKEPIYSLDELLRPEKKLDDSR